MQMIGNILIFIVINCIVIEYIECRKCPARYDNQENHSRCMDPSKEFQRFVMSDVDRETIIRLHDEIRGSVYPSAANMLPLQWDNDLQASGEGWASQCEESMDLPHQRREPGKYAAGQNVATGFTNWTSVVDDWSKGKTSGFVYGGDDNLNNPKAMQYVQMIYELSSRIGCARADCSGDKIIFVCNYAQSARITSAAKIPYKDSNTKCSGCGGIENCNDGLCGDFACLGAICENNGALQFDSNCHCNCKDDIKYVGDKCGLNCTAKLDDPACEFVNCTSEGAGYMCPHMCQDCPYADVGYSSGNAIVIHIWQTVPFVLMVLVDRHHW